MIAPNFSGYGAGTAERTTSWEVSTPHWPSKKAKEHTCHCDRNSGNDDRANGTRDSTAGNANYGTTARTTAGHTSAASSSGVRCIGDRS